MHGFVLYLELDQLIFTLYWCQARAVDCGFPRIILFCLVGNFKDDSLDLTIKFLRMQFVFFFN